MLKWSPNLTQNVTLVLQNKTGQNHIEERNY